MLLQIIGFIILTNTVQADFGYGSCFFNGYSAAKHQTVEIDHQKALGQWFEVMQDKVMASLSFTECSTCFVTNYFNDLAIQKASHLKILGWAITTTKFTNGDFALPSIGGLILPIWRLPAFLDVFGAHTEVLGTDPEFEDWAVVYGCTDWIFGLFHARHASLLSRTKHVTAATIRKAHMVLKAVKYDTHEQWSNSASASCGYSVDPDYPIQALEMFSSEPEWRKYVMSDRTRRIQKYFRQPSPSIPSGILTDEIAFEDDLMPTPFKQQLMTSDYGQYFSEEALWLDATKDYKVDVSILTDSFSSGADNIILDQATKNGQHEIYFSEVDDPTSSTSLLKHLNGFARVVVYSDSQGVVSVREGHFVNGVQNSFGRIIDLRGGQESSFVGWLPTKKSDGRGVALLGGTTLVGEFLPSDDFGGRPTDFLRLNQDHANLRVKGSLSKLFSR